jgi:mono/diheme cytochrome c family protein
MKRVGRVLLFLSMGCLLFGADGKKVFEKYCWGCHHQSAVAFGPPFSEIASKRSAQEIMGMIANPNAVSKLFGYKRNAMPPFKLSQEELKAITEYILSFKPKKSDQKELADDAKSSDTNITKAK